MGYLIPLTKQDKQTAVHITDGIYFKGYESGICELFVSNGETKSHPITIDHSSVGAVVNKLQSHFNR